MGEINNVETRIKLNKFIFRHYQKPVVDAIENRGVRKAILILPRRCVAVDTQITMHDGSIKPIQDISPGDKILSFNGKRVEVDTVKNSWSAGIKDSIEIVSHKFPNIITSPDHLFFSNGKWIKASQLKDNTKLFQRHSINSVGQDSKLAEIIAFLTHDGYVAGYQQPKFTNNNKDILNRVEQLIKQVFNYRVIRRKKGNGFDLGISNGTLGGGTFKNKVKELFRDYGLDVPKSKKFVHPIVWKQSREAVLAYIRAAISCDGSIYTRKAEEREICGSIKTIKSTCEITISCGKSFKLASDTYWLLRKIGIVPQTPKLEKKSNWQVKVGRSNDIIEILSSRIYGKEKASSLAMHSLTHSKVSHRHAFNKDLIVVTKHKSRSATRCEMYDIETKKNHNFFANGYLVHNSGKDLTAFQIAIRQVIRKVCVVYYILPTFNMARRIIWDSITNDGRKILDFAPDSICTKNSSEMKITVVNGSVLQLLGSTDYDKLRGTNPYGVVFSEYAYQNPLAYTTVRPILAVNNGWALFLSTPFGKNHFHDLYQVAKNSDDWFCQKLTVDDTQHMTDEALESERRSMSNDMFMQEYYTSFSQGVEGSYFSKYLNAIKLNNQVTTVMWEPNFPVHTSWDIGFTDSTAIIFFQVIGTSLHIIDYYENSKEGLDHYIKFLDTKPYKYGKHIAPHDMANHSFSTGISRIRMAMDQGVNFMIAENISILDGIEAIRVTLNRCYFDEVKCKKLLNHLNMYRQEWDDKRQMYRNKPYHGPESHGVDAFRMLCVSLNKFRNGTSAEDLNERYNRVIGGESNRNIPDIFR